MRKPYNKTKDSEQAKPRHTHWIGFKLELVLTGVFDLSHAVRKLVGRVNIKTYTFCKP